MHTLAQFLERFYAYGLSAISRTMRLDCNFYSHTFNSIFLKMLELNIVDIIIQKNPFSLYAFKF